MYSSIVIVLGYTNIQMFLTFSYVIEPGFIYLLAVNEFNVSNVHDSNN